MSALRDRKSDVEPRNLDPSAGGVLPDRKSLLAKTVVQRVLSDRRVS
jgi:hypothetical protein